MRTFGIIYVIAFLIDALVSILATFVPAAEGASNAITFLVTIGTVITFVLVCINKLQPRWYFIITSGFYVFMMACGVVLGVALAFKMGPQAMLEQTSKGSTFVLLRQQFSWYIFVHWTLLTIWTALGLYGVRVIQFIRPQPVNNFR
jgi:hypothetical protein